MGLYKLPKEIHNKGNNKMKRQPAVVIKVIIVIDCDLLNITGNCEYIDINK